MKKLELKLWLSYILIALCIGFTGCSDDDEGVNGDAKTLIIGTWESTWYKGYEIYNGKKETWDEAYTEDIYTFKNDGSGVYQDISGSTIHSENFKWSISGDKLKISLDGYSDEATIKTLNESTAVLTSYEKDEEGEFYNEITFKKK